MYGEADLDGAVAAGAISAAAAQALRDHVARARGIPSADDESFRLITGFNDVFVSIALVLTLGAVGGLGWSIGARPGETPNVLFQSGGTTAAAAVATVSWGLALFFTARRRMALPSILLLLAFVGGVAAAVAAGASLALARPGSDGTGILALASAAAAGAAYVHWRRFHVPITVAAGALAMVGVAIGLILSVPGAGALGRPATLAGGLALFVLAMRWDLSDPERRTRRADVAFWLHLAAAPMIAHPLFGLFGLLGGDASPAAALAVLGLYLVFAGVALAIDRRALLVSGLAYVVAAAGSLVGPGGALGLGWIATALVIGSALLSLSAFWSAMRRAVLARLSPDLARRLPPPAQPAVAPAAVSG